MIDLFDGFLFEFGRWLFAVGLTVAMLSAIAVFIVVHDWIKDRRRK